MSRPNERTGTRWLAAVGFGLVLVLTVILSLTPDATTYEISIYDAYPWYFWAIACLALVLGNVVIVRSASEETADWMYGLLLVGTVVGVLVFLPYFRGYAVFGRADVLSHVGYIRDIQETGAIGQRNIYPNFHLLVLSLAYVVGVDPSTMITGIAGIGSLFSIVSFLALVSTVFDRRRALLSLPFATVLVAVQSVPYVFSTLLVPFVLYLFVKERRTRTLHIRAALATTLFGIVIYHPITALFLLFIFGVYGVAQLLSDRNLLGADDGPAGSSVGAKPLSQLVVAVFAVWYLDFTTIVERFGVVVQNLAAPGGGGSPASTYSSTVSQYSPALVDLVRIALVRYGQSAILLTIGGLAALLFAGAVIWRRSGWDVSRASFVGLFTVFTGLSALFFLVDLVVGFGRPLLYAELFAALLSGSLFYALANTAVSRRTMYASLYGIVTLLVVFSTFGLYASPYSVDENQQVTRMELEGSEWYLEHRNNQVRLSEFGTDVHRYRDAIYGRESYGTRQVVTSDTAEIPPHFGYTDRETLGAGYEDDRYMVLTRAGRIFYPNLYPDYRQYWKYEQADFQRLDRDESVTQVYDNGEYDVYRVDAPDEEES
ncbi:hypothetical protein [Haloarcula salinisoli]|uniref:Uncharacterized protein n=1 Tax=Haloarcula salinisoli TaxID=2487746 RepID=A0A8J7YGH5_9EURY|nr:hypothetical protein [Halomicroarcula salinisoli]MBX0302881.1 hypothetical protein [Halomicroarcula salinisoli]